MENEIVISDPETGYMAATRPGSSLPTNPVSEMLQSVIAKGLTAENAAAMKDLVDLYKSVEAMDAKKQFNAAFSALQAELPTVVARQVVKNKDHTIRYTYANFQDIMERVRPHLSKHGFAVSFNIRVDLQGKDRICAICNLSHIGGHAQTNEFSVRVGSGAPGTSEAQADGGARSYARRGALCDALNITIDTDDDARMEGACISEEFAKALRNRVSKSGIEEKAFLAMAKAESFEKIRDGSYNILVNLLDMKERQKKNAASVTQPKSDPLKAQEAHDEAKDKPIIVPIPKVLLSWPATHEAMVQASMDLGLDDGMELDAWLKTPDVAAAKSKLDKRFDKEAARNLLIAFIRQHAGEVEYP